MKPIKIDIGGVEVDEDSDRDTIWYAVDTVAPADHDGFGTFTIMNTDEMRVVLIRDQHYTWQTSRYSSGVHWWQESVHDPATIAEALWDRLRKHDLQPA